MKIVTRIFDAGRRRAALSFQISALLCLCAAICGVRTAAAESVSGLTPWMGVWSISEEDGKASPSGQNGATVEMRMTEDRKGIQIIRRFPELPDLKEALIPDGTRRKVEAEGCSGWQSHRLIADAGVILGSSEMKCADREEVKTSSMRIILGVDEIVDVLGLTTGGQTRVAFRRLVFSHDLPESSELPPGWQAFAERQRVSAPWQLNTIIELSRLTNKQLLQAALLEKKSGTDLTPQGLKKMKAAKVPDEIVDLVVALTYRDEFHIEKNGEVELRPWIVSSSATSHFPDQSPAFPWIPASVYGCGPFHSFYSFADPCFTYYWSNWSDYVFRMPPTTLGTGLPNGGRGTVPGGDEYVTVQPRVRQAVRREEMSIRGGRAESGVRYPIPATRDFDVGTHSSSSPSPSAVGGSSSSSGASASPGGYSSGSSGGGTAVPR